MNYANLTLIFCKKQFLIILLKDPCVVKLVTLEPSMKRNLNLERKRKIGVHCEIAKETAQI